MPFELSVLDIDNWANTLPARSQLPRLLRRLALSHAEVERVEFAADEDTQIGGFDGVVVYSGTHPYLPMGHSVWELGVTSAVKGKADSDFEKRSYDKPAKATKGKGQKKPQAAPAPSIDRSQATFVFVTPRRWGANTSWADTQRKLGIWKDVRALNAGDLVTWLEQSPGVAVWFAGLIGKRPPGVLDAEVAWAEYAQMTRPATSPALVLGGRQQERERLLKFLSGPSDALGVQAESQDEAVAFLMACIQDAGDTERDTLLGRTVLVSTPDAFHTLVASPTPLVLVPTFSGLAGVTAATTAGHHVLVPHGRSEKVGGEAVKLPRPGRQAVQEALDGMGVPEGRRAQLGRLGRRSLLALRRALAAAREFETPVWADPAQGFPVPVLLAGMWHDESEGDQQVISRLGTVEYTALARTLNGWAVRSDPPLRRTGAAWMVSAPEDAWPLIKQLLLPQDITTFEELARTVLSEPDPSVTLPPDEQVVQRGFGTPRIYSDVLRDGLAGTLALLGTYSVDPDVNDLRLRSMVTRVVTALLGPPATWGAWATLARWLPLLAEASPEGFLDAAEQQTAEPDVQLANLIQDTGHTVFFHSPHSHLLWALEGLAWHPPYLPRVARVLFALARHDLPSPDTLNRPIRSLQLLLDGMMPSTTVPVSQRLAVLESLKSLDSALYTQLLQSLLPTDGGVKFGPVTPKYRDWVPDHFPMATNDEYAEFQEGIVAQLLRAGRDRLELLTFLLERARSLTAAQRAATLQAIREYTDSPITESETTASLREALRGVLRDETERQQRALTPEVRAELQAAVNAGDATDEQRFTLLADLRRAFQAFTAQELTDVRTLLTDLEPQDIVDQSAWLFKVNPAVPGVSRSDFAAYWNEVEQQRREAVRQVWTAKLAEGVEELTRRACEAIHVGKALAETGVVSWDEETTLLRRTLAHDTAALANLGWGYLLARSSNDPTWLERVQRELVPTWTSTQQATFFLAQPANPDTWTAVQTAGAEVQERYWDKVPVWALPADSFEQAVQGLLSRGRSFAALHFIAQHGRGGSAVPAEMVVDALEQVVKVKPTDHRNDVQGMPYMLTRLFGELTPTGAVSLARLAELEWFLWDCLPFSDHAPRSLSQQLVEDPEFFVQLVTLVYLADNESRERSALIQAQLENARRAREVLRRWKGVPGRGVGGTFDELQWQDWVVRVRALAAQRGYTHALEIEMAEVIARAARSSDGTWPHPAVCETIEQFASERLDRLIGIAVQNGRGIVTKAAYEGGQQEKALAQTFKNQTDPLQIQFPRTARILNQLAEVYLDESQDEDNRASFEQDL